MKRKGGSLESPLAERPGRQIQDQSTRVSQVSAGTTTPAEEGRWVKLDDVAGLERAVAELERLRYLREIDPPLREAILVRLGKLNPPHTREIRAALDEMLPAAVLMSYWRELIPDRPALGAYRRARMATVGERVP